MTCVRFLGPLAFAALLAACSGNIGSGQSTLPGTLPNGTTNVQQVNPPAPTASPESASNVATLGETAPQALPAVMGWSGTIAFPKPTTPPAAGASAQPKSSPSAPAASDSAVSVGVTAAVVDPPDAPRFNSGKGRRSGAKHADPNATTGLFFIALLATADVTLGEYPKIAIDVPREIAAKYRDDTFGLALYDPQTKGKTYRLAVAERDLTSPAPVAPSVATPSPSASPTTLPAGGPGPFTPPPVGSGLEAGTLPPEHVAFAATPATLILKANRPVVFALYVTPPQPTASPATAASPSPTASAAAVSPSPAASTATSAPAAAPSPSASAQ